MTGLRSVWLTLDENYRDFVKCPPSMKDPWVERLLNLVRTSRAKVKVTLGLKKKQGECFERTEKERWLRAFDTSLKKALERAREGREGDGD